MNRKSVDESKRGGRIDVCRQRTTWMKSVGRKRRQKSSVQGLEGHCSNAMNVTGRAGLMHLWQYIHTAMLYIRAANP